MTAVGTQGPSKELKSALLERPLCGENIHDEGAASIQVDVRCALI
jgi:hypothetical protein